MLNAVNAQINYEPYQVVNPLGQRGLGGNAKLKQLQQEYRLKNRSNLDEKGYKQGVSVSTISSLGFREVPIERTIN